MCGVCVWTYLAADETADKLLGGPGRLVPRAGGAIGVVFGDALRGHCRSGYLGSSVGCVVLVVALLLLGTALGLSYRESVWGVLSRPRCHPGTA